MDDYFIDEKTSVERTLDLFVFISVFIITIFLVIDLLDVNYLIIDKIYLWISVFVLIIFSLDLVRLWKNSYGFKDFISHNWLDILATIPFELIAYGLSIAEPGTVAAFGILKWFRFHKLSKLARIQRISRISKISKELKVASHLKRESSKYKKNNKL